MLRKEPTRSLRLSLDGRFSRDMGQIQLANGGVAWVDDEDVAYLNTWRWLHVRASHSGITYACRYENQKIILMHRVLMNAPDGQRVDHKSGEGLDNRRSNLRFCSHAQNLQNQRANGTGSSRFKGVRRIASRNRWRAEIGINKRQLHLGYFADETEAARAYDEAARKYFGEFARPNFQTV
jgi:hypothetical protein